MITRYTTPPISLLVKGIDITSADVYVTLKQREIELTIDNPVKTFEDPNTIITFSLTQKQSGKFSDDYVQIQVNWMSGGTRYATKIVETKIYDNLYNEVIE